MPNYPNVATCTRRTWAYQSVVHLVLSPSLLIEWPPELLRGFSHTSSTTVYCTVAIQRQSPVSFVLSQIREKRHKIDPRIFYTDGDLPHLGTISNYPRDKCS